MTQTQQNLLALSSDLVRICNSIQSRSYRVSDRFSQEAFKLIREIPSPEVKPYMSKLLRELEDKWLKEKNDLNKAERCLMYSVLLRNYAMKGN